MINNLSEYFRYHSEKKSKHIFCQDLKGNSLTYLKIDERINQSCRLFQKLNLKHNSIVTLKLDNSFEFLILYFACLRSNIIVNPIPNSLSDAEVNSSIDLIKPNLFVSRNSSFIKKINRFKIYDIIDYYNFESILKNFDGTNFKPLKQSINDVACIYHSSGTTGNPKCVEYTHSNMIELIRCISLEFKFSEKDIFLGVLPLGHTAIINYQLLPCVFLGAKIIITKNFNSVRSKLWEIIRDNGISNLQVVPTILFSILATPYDKTIMNQNKTLNYISCGSAPLSKNTQIIAENILGLPVSNLYGLSETGPSHFDYPLKKNWSPGSIGIPLTVNECIIFNEKLEECQVGENGQIALKGKNVFKGYYKNEIETKKVFYNDFFLTGDIGYKDDKNNFYFSDRVKDLIIKGGVNIVPGEIEEIIFMNSSVLSVAVLGKPDKLFGEDIVAFIIKKKDKNLSEKEVIDFASKFLQPLKIPRDIRFIKEMPIGPSGKILKKELRKIL